MLADAVVLFLSKLLAVLVLPLGPTLSLVVVGTRRWLLCYGRLAYRIGRHV
jgi:hypothetical protein